MDKCVDGYEPLLDIERITHLKQDTDWKDMLSLMRRKKTCGQNFNYPVVNQQKYEALKKLIEDTSTKSINSYFTSQTPSTQTSNLPSKPSTQSSNLPSKPSTKPQAKSLPKSQKSHKVGEKRKEPDTPVEEKVLVKMRRIASSEESDDSCSFD